MRVCHGATAVFDDPNFVWCAGLAPVLELAERSGLQELAAEHVRVDKRGGGKAVLKVLALVAAMIAGADSVEDMGLLRHGAMRRLFAGVRGAVDARGVPVHLHCRVQRMVVLSVMGVNPALPHWRRERMVHAASVPMTALRPPYFAQNLLTAFGDDIRERSPLALLPATAACRSSTLATLPRRRRGSLPTCTTARSAIPSA